MADVQERAPTTDKPDSKSYEAERAAANSRVIDTSMTEKLAGVHLQTPTLSE